MQLCAHRGDYYLWTGSHWADLEPRDVKARIYPFLEHAVYDDIDVKADVTPRKPFRPTARKVADILEALSAIVHVRSHDEAPLWMDERRDPPACELIAMANGLLHVPTRTLRAHSALFFNHHSLPFAFDPQAPAPQTWLAFLHELWADDPTAIATLQEVFGYVLGGDTRQQKMFLLVGPKRGGKGTIGRVLTGLLGPHHVAAPTLASLATNFGLQTLIGKPLALVSDARLSTKSDSKIVVERLLSVSGEDSLTIDRKY